MTDEQFGSELQPSIQEDNVNVIKTLFEIVKEQTRKIEFLEGLPQDAIEIKTTAGDYAVGSSWDGRRVLNTSDNTYKIFAEGAWRQILAY